MDDRRVLIAFGRVAGSVLRELAVRYEDDTKRLCDLAGEFDALSQRLESILLRKPAPQKVESQ